MKSRGRVELGFRRSTRQQYREEVCEKRSNRASLGKKRKDGSVEAGKSQKSEDITSVEKVCVCVCFIAVAPPTPPSR